MPVRSLNSCVLRWPHRNFATRSCGPLFFEWKNLQPWHTFYMVMKLNWGKRIESFAMGLRGRLGTFYISKSMVRTEDVCLQVGNPLFSILGDAQVA